MRRLILPIVAILMLMPMAIGCVPAEDTAPVPSNPVATQALNVANTNTGSVQALGARMAALEGVTAGEVTQAELDALAEQVAVLSAQVTVLETTIPGSTIGPDGTVVEDALAETRWRMRFFPEWDTVYEKGTTNVVEDSVGIYIYEIVPRTIKEAGVYEITIDIVNESEPSVDIDIQNLMLEFRFEPSDDVYVSDMSDIYQVIGPYSVYWNVGIRENTTSGTCRYITADTEQFDLDIDAGEGEIERIELEFELVYGE